MAILSENNIKSELSYAYLHAVASRAGIECVVAGRHADGAGVDATLRARERFAPGSLLTHFTVDVQLKATSAEVAPDDRGRYPFPLTVDHYDKLRDPGAAAQQILVVLYLPPDSARWLEHSADGLVARRSAYWTSLRNAPRSQNRTTQTVYIPGSRRFTVDAVRSIFTGRSLGGWIDHEA